MKKAKLPGDFLFYLSKRNITAITEMLYSKDIDKNCSDIDGNTLMHYAVTNKSISTICLLLDQKYPFSKKETRNNRTPLELAFKLKQGEIAALLYNQSTTLNTAEETAFTKFKQLTEAYEVFKSTLELLNSKGLEKYAKFKGISLTPPPKQKSLYERALSLWSGGEKNDDQKTLLIDKKNI
jgi:hypothetical protein